MEVLALFGAADVLLVDLEGWVEGIIRILGNALNIANTLSFQKLFHTNIILWFLVIHPR